MLRKVTMKNFMCFGEKEVTFNNAMSVVNGQNGKGKTTVGTAILWAIFNRNYELKDNPVVRKSDVSDKSDVEVELVFDNMTLRKVQKRKRNENNPAEYTDTNSYYVNEVSVTMKEYNKRIGEDIKTVLMGCAVNAFLSEKPETLRTYLFSHVGDVSDKDVAASDPALADILTLLNKYNLEEIKAMNKKVVSDCNREMPVIEGQIKEKERDIQLASEIDVSALELQLKSIDERIAEQEEKLENSDRILAEQQKKSDGILELRFKLTDMERNATEANRKASSDIESQIRNIKDDITRVETEITHHQDKEKHLKESIDETTSRIKNLQLTWKTENERVMDDSSLVCPYCKREYEEDKKETIKAEFDTHKNEVLNRITVEGETEHKLLIKYEKERDSLNDTITELFKTLNEHKEKLLVYEHQLEDIKPVDIRTTKEYQDILAEIQIKEEAMKKEVPGDTFRAELKESIKILKAERDCVSAQIVQSNTESYETRLSELLEQCRAMEQRKADAEKILDLVDSFEKAKNSMVSDKVNSLFGLVKFQLFEYTKGGVYKNVCIPTVNGKSLLDNNSNKALRILGKLDICNAIQKLEGTDLPIILDDGEALDSANLNRLSSLTDKQIIVLKVSEDKDLVIS